MVASRLWTLQARNLNFQAETRLVYRICFLWVSSNDGMTRHDLQGEGDTLKPRLYILTYAGTPKCASIPQMPESFPEKGSRIG